jgi:hypothetical protein
MTFNVNDTAVWTLADGTQVDTMNLPEGTKVCPYCMHLHDVADIHTGPITKERHWNRLKRLRPAGPLAYDEVSHPHLTPGHEYTDHQVTGDIECVGCRAHGPHPDMPE